MFGRKIRHGDGHEASQAETGRVVLRERAGGSATAAKAPKTVARSRRSASDSETLCSSNSTSNSGWLGSIAWATRPNGAASPDGSSAPRTNTVIHGEGDCSNGKNNSGQTLS